MINLERRLAVIVDIIDMHTHSTHSVDAHNSIQEMCDRALELNLEGICFTEHLDMHPEDPAFDYFDLISYLNDIQEAKEKYQEELIVLGGVEFCEPQSYPEKLKEIELKEVDVVLASIHWMEEMMFGQGELINTYSPAEIYKRYYKLILEMVEHGGFEVLAHFDLPKRYLDTNKGKHVHLDLIKEILKKAITRDIVLEINTSSLRRGMDELLPGEKIIQIYTELGGNKVTLGSDAHRVSDIAADFDRGQEVIEKYNLECGYFKEREFISN